MGKSNHIDNPIIVTGSERSGTTWVGKMIGKSSEVAYIHEPLQPDKYSPGALRIKSNYFHTYITEENESEFFEEALRIMNLEYDVVKAVGFAKSLREKFRRIRSYLYYKECQIKRCRPLLKSPFALFSLEWFAKRFNAIPVVMIRHPAAYVESIKRKNWASVSTVEGIFRQELLMRHHLGSLRKDFENWFENQSSYDIVDRASLLWKAYYSAVHHYIKKFENEWIFIKHEDLSRDPVMGFRNIFDNLGLKYSREIEEAVWNNSKPDNPSIAKGVFDTRIDSLNNIDKWKKNLLPEEIDRIKHIVGDVSEFFYGGDW